MREAQGMKLSVLVITYNHERFIAEALQSALAQEVDFDYEIVVGDDFSTDGTRLILSEMCEAYPDRLRLLGTDKNLGMNHNFVRTLKACRGQYIALLEGDDCWISTSKLSKQVEFLDRHSECAICFHDVMVTFEDGQKARNFCPPDQKPFSELEDLLRGNFIQTCSAVFRNRLFGEFPEWFYSLKLGDWPFHVFNARFGRIGYLNETMAIYRVHGSGVWSSSDRIRKLEATLEMYENLALLFDGRRLRVIKSMAALHCLELARLYQERGFHDSAVASFRRAFKMDLRCYEWLLTHQYGKLLKVLFPDLHKGVKKLLADPLFVNPSLYGRRVLAAKSRLGPRRAGFIDSRVWK
jgi:glycosyltransferase involved in cell wall biosynthesis